MKGFDTSSARSNFRRIQGLVQQITSTLPVYTLLEKYTSPQQDEDDAGGIGRNESSHIEEELPSPLKRTMSTYNSQNREELKHILKSRFLPVSGTKEDLVIRLVEDDIRNSSDGADIHVKKRPRRSTRNER